MPTFGQKRTLSQYKEPSQIAFEQPKHMQYSLYQLGQKLSQANLRVTAWFEK